MQVGSIVRVTKRGSENLDREGTVISVYNKRDRFGYGESVQNTVKFADGSIRVYTDENLVFVRQEADEQKVTAEAGDVGVRKQLDDWSALDAFAGPRTAELRPEDRDAIDRLASDFAKNIIKDITGGTTFDDVKVAFFNLLEVGLKFINGALEAAQ